MNTHRISLVALGLSAALFFSACNTKVTDPGTPPPSAQMSFKSGARYQYASNHTDPSNPSQKSDSSSRVWALVQASATAHGKSNVGVYVDSILALGGVGAWVVDSVYLQQSTGSNDIYRYASLAPELDFSAGASLVPVDLGKQWSQEARLNATAAAWLVGEASDTIQYDVGIPAVQGMKVAVKDTAVASSVEQMTIDGMSYSTTKTTHKLELSISIIIDIPIVGRTSVKVASESLTRTTWMSHELGAIVREEREGKVINASYSGQNFQIPVPGYLSVMTKVLAKGN
jgi:hypothetical protein